MDPGAQRRLMVGIALGMVLLLSAHLAAPADYRVVASLPGGLQPQQVIVDPAARWVFVANTHLDAGRPGISIFDASSLERIQTIDDAGVKVTCLLYEPGSERLYAASSEGLSVYEWHQTAGRFLPLSHDRFRFEGYPDWVLVTAMRFDGRLNRIYLTKLSPDQLNFAALDLASGRFEEVSVPGFPRFWGMELDEAGGRIYLPDYLHDQVIVLRASDFQVLTRITVGDAPYAVKLVDAEGPVLYVANRNAGTVSVIRDTVVMGPSFFVGVLPINIVVDHSENRAYVINQGDGAGPGTVTVVNTETHRPVTTIPVGIYPIGAALSGTSPRLMVSNSLSNSVSVIDTVAGAEIQKVRTGAQPYGAVYHPAADRLFVTCRQDDLVELVTVPPDPRLSSVTAVPDLIPMDGTSTSLVTVVPRDEDGRELGPGYRVTIDTTMGELLGVVVDEQDGRYTQRLQSIDRHNPYYPNSVAATVTSEVEGIALDDWPRVTFAAYINFPSIKILEPGWGYTAGMEQVRLVGTNFGAAPSVYFDATEATCWEAADNFDPGDDQTEQTLVCLSPPHPEGAVDVVLYNVTRYVIVPDGYVYIGDESFVLTCTLDETSGAIVLAWPDGGYGPFTVVRADTRDFSSGRTLFEDVDPPFTDPSPPAGQPILYYRLEP